MTLKNLGISKSWTLFLDRDGVINRRLVDDYVKSWGEFEFLPGVPEALARFSGQFGHILVVTNQQGIGKGLMSAGELDEIHQNMLNAVKIAGGRIDKIYVCPHLKEQRPFCRKPQVGMGLQARKDFPQIDFKKSVMAGDSVSDLRFGRRLGMKTVLISTGCQIAREHPALVDFCFGSLTEFADAI